MTSAIFCHWTLLISSIALDPYSYGFIFVPTEPFGYQKLFLFCLTLPVPNRIPRNHRYSKHGEDEGKNILDLLEPLQHEAFIPTGTVMSRASLSRLYSFHHSSLPSQKFLFQIHLKFHLLLSKIISHPHFPR